MNFQKFVGEKHPDPDSVLIENPKHWEQLCMLAEAYAEYKIENTVQLEICTCPFGSCTTSEDTFNRCKNCGKTARI